MGDAQRYLVTGGAGFIGSALARHLVTLPGADVLVVDALTYAGRRDNLDSIAVRANFAFRQADICDARKMRDVLSSYRPDIVMHLAAETHVDRSIDAPNDFVATNVLGTVALLDASLGYFRGLREADAARFRFHHVSTDEVFGSLGNDGLFTEATAYDPHSPYAASKASADHFVRAWHHTFGLPVVISNCSNNFGPHQFPEKLIPLAILNAVARKPIPVYGDGGNVRDWLYVEDCARALSLVGTQGVIGLSYNIGGRSERRNIDVVKAICALVDEALPDGARPREELITFVTDRPGHDRRYALDDTRVRTELGWAPRETFQTGLRETVRWYLDNRDWWQAPRTMDASRCRLGLVMSRA